MSLPFCGAGLRVQVVGEGARLFRYIDCRIGGHDERTGSIYDVFVFVPEKRPIAFQFRKVRLKDGHSRDDAAGDECVVGAIVAVADQFRLRADAGYIRDI